ncbi:hypothetical protein M0802_016190 [Mischocyttarus mexicanus]|nr:hypothetical protein M0802_016190 [Mischocyttarus mexicanus]
MSKQSDRVFLSKNIKSLRQGFLSEKLGESQNKKIGMKINLQQLEFYFSKNIKRLRQGFLSKKLRVLFSKNIKRLRQGFLSKKLRESQNKKIGWEVKRFSQGKFQNVASGFSELNVKEKSKQSDRQRGQGSKKLLVYGSQGFPQQKVKVKTKQRDRQGGEWAKKLLVWLSQSLLKDKTRLIQDKSTTFRVLFSKNIKRLRQGFLSEKLRESQNKKIRWEVKRFSQGKFQNVASGFSELHVKEKSKQSDRQRGQGSKKLLVYGSQGKLKDNTRLIPDKSTTDGFFFSKNIKRWRQGFLIAKLR